jgi:hypothetical protein
MDCHRPKLATVWINRYFDQVDHCRLTMQSFQFTLGVIISHPAFQRDASVLRFQKSFFVNRSTAIRWRVNSSAFEFPKHRPRHKALYDAFDSRGKRTEYHKSFRLGAFQGAGAKVDAALSNLNAFVTVPSSPSVSNSLSRLVKRTETHSIKPVASSSFFFFFSF